MLSDWTEPAGDLAAPADSPEGAAARIQASELDAKKRRATIRYLGTVDCRYWPEAEAALITGLRSDPNECVRYEAALALTNGCCCTKSIIDALVLCVSGSTKDNHPAETSQRVRNQAGVALERCLCRYTQVVGAPDASQRPEKPERPLPAPPPHGIRPRDTLPVATLQPSAITPPCSRATAPAYVPPPLGQRSLYDLAMHARARGTDRSPPPASGHGDQR